MPLPEQTLVPLTGAGAQGKQSFAPKHPVWTVLPAQTPPQRCCPAGQPMPDPTLALADTELVVAPLLLLPVALDDVAPVVVPALVVALTPPAPVVAGSLPPPLVVAPGPSATLPPTPPPPKPPSPSLLTLVSAALAQPWPALPIASATNIKPKPIVFTRASENRIVAHFMNDRDLCRAGLRESSRASPPLDFSMHARAAPPPDVVASLFR